MKGYRFFSNPGHVVSDGNTGLPLFKFDEKGEYVTLDTVLAKRMAPHFQHQEIEFVEVKEPAGEAVEENTDDEDTFPCPHCEFVAVSKSGLSSHIRAKHKEG